MEKLRQIGRLIWASKERLVLVVMVAVLCYQVYRVVKPADEEGSDIIARMPSGQIPEDRTGLNLPEMPKPPQLAIDTSDFSSLYKRNPFWYFSTGGAAQQAAGPGDEKPNVTLVRITQWPDGSYRAQIRTQSNTEYIVEGADFEDYTLLSIDPDAQTCRIYDAKQGKEYVLGLQ